MAVRTLFDKLWEAHVVRDLGEGWALLHIDRHLMHDLGGGPGFAELAARGLELHDPDLTFATADHAVSSQPGRVATTFPLGGRLHAALRDGAAASGVRFASCSDSPEQAMPREVRSANTGPMRRREENRWETMEGRADCLVTGITP